jgi:mRNA interferase RelE/StbE
LSWTIRYGSRVPEDLKKLDKPAQRRALDYLEDLAHGGPRARGEALTGNLAGLWRYRVGPYRVVAETVDDQLIIIAVRIAHRSEIYRAT